MTNHNDLNAIGHKAMLLTKRWKYQKPSDEERAWIKGYFDLYSPNSPEGRRLARRYPAEAQEWRDESENGLRNNVTPTFGSLVRRLL